MLRTRVMPCLLLRGSALVKTVRFRAATYVGDPVNTVRIYNEKEVDELIVLDVTATRERRRPPFEIVERLASECFMPLTYGGGVRSLDDMQTLFRLGVEKVAVNAHAVADPDVLRRAADRFGRQSLVAAIDVRRRRWRGPEVRTHGGTRRTGLAPARWAQEAEHLGAGEILLTSIDRDGTFEGYDLDLVRSVAGAVDVPVIACGGAGRVEDFAAAVEAGAAAVAAGSLFVFQNRLRGVLINVPPRDTLDRTLGEGPYAPSAGAPIALSPDAISFEAA